MANNPLNLTLRFVLELIALGILAAWGWQHGGLLLALALPLIGATLWGVFRVPGDTSARQEAPVAVPGLVRLVLEGALFVSATVMLNTINPRAALILGLVLLAHYALSYDRVAWLLRQS